MKRTTTQALCLAAGLALSAATLSASGIDNARRAVPRGSGGIAITAATPAEGHATTHVRQIKPAPAGFTAPRQARTAAPEASVLAAPSMKAPGRRPLYGNVVYADSWTDASRAGIYRIPTGPGEFVPVHTSAEMTGENAVMTPSAYWLTYIFQGMFGDFQRVALYDPADWSQTADNVVQNEFDAAALAYDTATATTYGSFRSGNEYYFGTLNTQTNTVTQTGTSRPQGLTSMAADGAGQLYATTTDGAFVKVDKTTGVTTTVATIGLVSAYNTSGAIDPGAGIYYYAYTTDAASALYAIDLATGAANKLYDMPDGQNIVGMWTGAPEGTANAPGTVDNLTVTLAGAALSATVEFDMPGTLYDGTPATGAMTWTVKVDGTQAASGTANAGAHVSATVTVSAQGNHTVEAYATNSAGQGPVQAVSRWFGTDNLTAIPTPALSADGQLATLTWEAPRAVNGGFIDPAKLKYNVTRMPDGNAVATGITATSFTETLPQTDGLSRLYYDVTVVYDGAASDPVSSNQIILGHRDVPYTETFDTYGCFDYMTVINGNGDNRSWQWQDLYGPGSNAMLQYGTADHDDWLILPPVRLDRGAFYELSLDVWVQDENFPERMEVCIGTSPLPSAMTTVIIPAATYNNVSDNTLTLTEYFVPQSAGDYYIGIHATSAAERAYQLHVDNVAVARGINAAAPKAVTGLTATPGEYGALTAEIAFTAPDTDMSEKPITALTRVDIYRGETRIGSVTPAPGARASFTDTQAVHGDNTYRVVAVAGDMEGEPATVTCFVGIAAPRQVQNVKVTRGADTGEVRLTWDRVTHDVNGMGLRDDQVTYDVYRIEDEHQRVIASDITVNEASERICAADAPQQFVVYQVKAYTRYGSAPETEADIIPVGKPDGVPFVESVAGGHLSHDWAQQLPEENGEYWQTAYDNYIEGISAVDLDGGYMAMSASFIGYEGTLMSGNIAIPADIVNPGLSFYYFNYDSNNYIDVLINDGNGFVKLMTVTLDGSDAQDGWARKVIPLDAYKGKTVQIAFRGVIAHTNIIALDAISIDTMPASDLTPREFMLPESVAANEPFDITLKVENVGSARAEGYTVTLWRDGEAVETQQGPAIDPSTSHTFVFHQVADIFSEGYTEYHATVDYAADEVTANNTSRVVGVAVKMPNTPTIDDLRARRDGTSVSLTWSEPDIESMTPEAITDGVEDYVPFSIGLPGSVVEGDDMGAWSVIDGDGTTTYTLSGTPFPNSGAEMSFIVFNGYILGVEGTHGGDQMFMSFNPYDIVSENPVRTDDWLISPELYGGAQTIRFYARSMNAQFLETMEMYWSTGGTAREDFTKAGEVKQVSADWTEYTFDVPEGARRFALRNVSYDMFALCIDDITYIPADAGAGNLTVTGYNLYRDRVRLNDTPVTELAWTDTDVPAGEHIYHVTVVYSNGESCPSNGARVAAALDGVAAEAVTVTGGAGVITVTGADGLAVTVCTPDGRVTARTTGTAATTAIPAAPGVYIVTAGPVTVKTAVR